MNSECCQKDYFSSCTTATVAIQGWVDHSMRAAFTPFDGDLGIHLFRFEQILRENRTLNTSLGRKAEPMPSNSKRSDSRSNEQKNEQITDYIIPLNRLKLVEKTIGKDRYHRSRRPPPPADEITGTGVNRGVMTQHRTKSKGAVRSARSRPCMKPSFHDTSRQDHRFGGTKQLRREAVGET